MAALTARRLSVFFSGNAALKDVSIEIPAERIVAVIGPAGAGKTSLLRSFNRMNELCEGARTTGRVQVFGRDIYAPKTDVGQLRREVGMVFHESAPFPMSIFDNVAYAPQAARQNEDIDRIVERALVEAGLWSQVADSLGSHASQLSAEERQRLCIARTLAAGAKALLLDEPTSKLDARATRGVEALLHSIRRKYTILIATTDHQQAARLSDHTLYLDRGEAVEYGKTASVFTNPKRRRTEAYLTGRGV